MQTGLLLEIMNCDTDAIGDHPNRGSPCGLRVHCPRCDAFSVGLHALEGRLNLLIEKKRILEFGVGTSKMMSETSSNEYGKLSAFAICHLKN
jgi:hypothetical protein